jgi:hypothetical protein
MTGKIGPLQLDCELQFFILNAGNHAPAKGKADNAAKVLVRVETNLWTRRV